MATKQVRNTASGAAIFKAFEQHVPAERRLFDDPIIERMLTGVPARMLRHTLLRTPLRALMDRFEPGLIGAMACRTRAIDDATVQAVAGGVRQVVILGAGIDTRPYRMAELRDVTVWELDLPEVQRSKTDAVIRTLGALPGHVRYLPIDLAENDAETELGSAGWDAGQPTLVIWEGVSQYLPRPVAERTLRFAGALTAGSRIVFTYLPQRVIDGTDHAKSVRRLQWQTGFAPDTLARDLDAVGLDLTDDLGAAEYRTRYLGPLGRDLVVFDIERIAIARVPAGGIMV